MRRLLWLLAGIVIGGASMWIALGHTIVRTNDGVTWVPKRHPTLRETYLDIRNWTPSDWREHPDLLWSAAEHRRGDLLGELRDDALSELWRSLGQER